MEEGTDCSFKHTDAQISVLASLENVQHLHSVFSFLVGIMRMDFDSICCLRKIEMLDCYCVKLDNLVINESGTTHISGGGIVLNRVTKSARN